MSGLTARTKPEGRKKCCLEQERSWGRIPQRRPWEKMVPPTGAKPEFPTWRDDTDPRPKTSETVSHKQSGTVPREGSVYGRGSSSCMNEAIPPGQDIRGTGSRGDGGTGGKYRGAEFGNCRDTIVP